jgi:hypothetical protein
VEKERLERQVEIVCDGCGDVNKTDEYVRRIAKAFSMTPLAVHEALWDGMEINGVPIEISGATVRRVEDVTPHDPAA